MNRKPYSGPKRRLVLAFDLGTTFSGVSYAILDPGKVPNIQTVARYPGQEAGDLKIPTIIYYDALGNALAMGAEAPPVNDEDEDDTEESKPTKLEWFKLLMRPKGATVPEGIPRHCGRYADFYRYLFDRAKEYICQTHASKELFWKSVEGDIDFVLSHPNGWEGPQQGKMRKAAIQAGLIPDTPEGHARITFVTEGEASFHYCISSGKVSDVIKAGNNVMVIDAGGGTVDISTYTFSEASPLKIKEIATPEGVFEGSVMIKTRFTKHITAKLRNSRFGTQAYVDDMSDKFDEGPKKRFKGVDASHIKFSSSIADKDIAVGIRNGQIKVSAFFDPGVEAIIEVIKAQQKETAPSTVSTYFLVGGFSASEYLYKKLNAYLNDEGLRLFRPDNNANKAVADGAVSFHIDRFVSTRLVKLTYGSDGARMFMPWVPSHRERASRVLVGLDGIPCIPGSFESIVHKASIMTGTEVAEKTTYEETFQACSIIKDNLNTIECDIICYRGDGIPEFMDEDPDSFSNLCKVSADLSAVPKKEIYGPRGRYYKQTISVVLELGLTELKAHLAWEHKHRGPATIVYDDDSDI
ncbi:hypothetical protein OF83DRAFT_1227634 [Amylostereum chailletii]|nr:hypothetical protein OF83DRAFT_1227634 [Amylostereum chailletii]